MPTVLCGSLSLHPVSLGSVMHRAGYAALGLDYVYVPFKISDVQAALEGMRALGIRGFGVSMPYKLEVMPWLDLVDPLASRIGAVNTIVNDAGHLTGFNTDALGARRALEEILTLAERHIVVVGAGGAARAVAFSLLEAGARVHVANRTPDKAAALADALTDVAGDASRVSASGLDGPVPHCDVLVNASSGGMQDVSAECPVPLSWVDATNVVMDIVYKPLQTELLIRARALGKRTVHGGRMLLHQAAGQFELYTGAPAPLEVMDRALRGAIGEPDATAVNRRATER